MPTLERYMKVFHKILLPIAFVTSASNSKAASEVTKELSTRFGTGEILEDHETYQHVVKFKEKVALSYEGEGLELGYQFQRDHSDILIFEGSTGGIACPYDYFILEIENNKDPVVSKRFGSCSEIADTRTEGQAIILEMPAYTPHPELLTPKEVRLRDKTTEVYRWEGGKLSMKEKTK